MKRFLAITGLLVIISILTAMVGCTPGTSSPTGLGTLELRVTDAPPKDNVTSIMVTVSKVEVHLAGSGPEPTPTVTVSPTETTSPTESPTATPTETPETGEWITIDVPSNASTFDLLKIKGVEQTLASNQIQPGKYTQVRLIVEDINVGIDGATPVPAELPSGELKFVQPFEIQAGETTTVLFDFDADRSVNVTGNNTIMVKPVVKLTVREGVTGPNDDNNIENSNEKEKTNEETNLQIAENFIKNEATFVFDGIPGSLRLAETFAAQDPDGNYFIFEFQSRHAGYGDRTGQVLAQVITNHRVNIRVIDDKVTEAIMDDVWDMLKQQEIPASTPPTQTA